MVLMPMEVLHLDQFSEYLKPRPRTFHKGEAGHILIIGGNLGFSGAIRLGAEAALRVGAGLVSLATHPTHAALLNSSRPEIMCHGVHDAKDLEPLLLQADVVVVGPGLGQVSWSEALFEAALLQNKPLIVDADALNLLAKNPIKKDHWILTPHPGEAARLLNWNVADIQRDRVAAVKELKNIFGGVCILKGAHTLVLSHNNLPVVCEAGNPGMATAGMGDVLCGVIAGLLGQQIPLDIAGKMGVLIHALAADFAAEQGERGMIASDLLIPLRKLVNYES